ncbi:transcription termination factor NusA [Deferribacterales bacterium Es71-Z0220]|jgi:N utilization substance protein A|uniref:transcription termination factor NusA n=1 Tax=Deferrivibrio essentukiensis TaxID=2880922 RepID=UPI001F605063|nr:transcription termination factor NusA [Deferrivibrio essentukiensis]MBZ4672279.1 NusA antitermination factor [Deferribacteraceae bacterium]MCB4203589.1 transcription termination factor NusA [Deferrivibrio essentukiensis]
MIREFAKVADELGREKGLSRSMLSEVLREAIVTAVHKKIGKYGEPEVTVDIEKGTIKILIPKEVSEEIDSKWHEISIEEAKKYKENPQLGDIVMVPTTLEALGRQAAIAAKNKLLEKIRDAERQVIYEQFQNKVGEILNGTVLKTERDNLVVNIGKAEAILPKRESIPADFFGRGDYVRALLLEIRVVKGWPQLILSRTHPEFLKKLFEMEIPEVYEGIIDVKGVAREPGDRAKVAVYSTNSNIDPVGACIGLKGVRINSISQELRGEKIDVIEWSPDPVKYVCNAISPAQVLLTNIFEDEETIEVVVPDDELSLAIGKKGQNVKLAAMLTGWRLDVLKESEYNEIRKVRLIEQEQEFKEFDELYNLEHIDVLTDEMVRRLVDAGIDDVEKLSTSNLEEVAAALEISDEEAINIINSAIDYLTSKLAELQDDDFTEESEEEE